MPRRHPVPDRWWQKRPAVAATVAVGAVLALVIGVAPPAAAASFPRGGPAALSTLRGAAGGARSVTGVRAAAPNQVVPCPIAKVPSPTSTPRKPSGPPLPPPPTRDPDAPVVGGDALRSPGLLVPKGAKPLPTTLNAQAWVLADLDSGDILAACAPHAYHPPASTQKLLTALVTLPKLDPQQVVTVTEEDVAIEPGSSAVGLVKGGKYSIKTIELGLLLASGNDAANVLARLAGGPRGVQGTIADMNAEARRLGAMDTTAVTPSGLDGPGQYTSAYDLALIARADFARPDFRQYTATERTVIPAQPPKFPRAFQIQNDNKLLTRYPGGIGGKTGFTDFARHTYVGAAERGGRRLVITMMRGEVRPQRLWQQGAALLDWGFALSRDAKPVGQLVQPGKSLRAAAKPVPAGAARPGVRPAARPGGAGDAGAGFQLVDLIGLALVAGTFGIGVLWVVRATRRWLSRRRRSGSPLGPGGPHRPSTPAGAR